jgi:16S rRNA pseudouridine516 synthase
MTTTARLDRLLGNLGYGTRKDIQRLASAGLIVMDGQGVPDAARRVPVGPDLTQRLLVRGEPVDPPAPLTLMMHKPLGVVCSHKEDGERVYDLLPPRWRVRDPALSTIGRLDKETSGLLLITDDGPLLHRVISPKNHVVKRYVARLARPLEGHEAALFASGTLLLEGEDKPLAPAQMEALGPDSARLSIREGRYHQVRRMFAAAGNHVLDLRRESIGGLALPDDLAPGAFRILSNEDAARIFAG